jgi:hypothetical protein
MVSYRMVPKVYQQLNRTKRRLTELVKLTAIGWLLMSCSTTHEYKDGSKVVDCVLKTRDECVVLFAESCQEGFTIEHDYGFEMVGRCVR